MAHSTRCPAPTDHLQTSTGVPHGLQQETQEVGGWREAGGVAFMLLFYMFVLGLATHPSCY